MLNRPKLQTLEAEGIRPRGPVRVVALVIGYDSLINWTVDVGAICRTAKLLFSQETAARVLFSFPTSVCLSVCLSASLSVRQPASSQFYSLSKFHIRPKLEYTRIIHLPKKILNLGLLTKILVVVVNTQNNGAHKESENTEKKTTTHAQTEVAGDSGDNVFMKSFFAQLFP